MTPAPLARVMGGTSADRLHQADVVIRALHRAFYAALFPRADGSRHHRNCINRHVNATPRPCSDACLYATGALLLAEDWEDGLPLPANVAPRQLELIDHPAPRQAPHLGDGRATG